MVCDPGGGLFDPGSHGVEQVREYLDGMSRNPGILDWQYQQIVDAIQNLLTVVNWPCLDMINWTHLKAATRRLEEAETGAGGEGILPSNRIPGRAPLIDRVKVRHGELLDRLVTEIRVRKYSIRTEQAYLGWACRFLLFLKEKEPQGCGGSEIAEFLGDPAVRGQVAASTRNQALNALIFLYTQVLGRDIGDLGSFARAKRPKRLPVVLSRGEIGARDNSDAADRVHQAAEGTFQALAATPRIGTLYDPNVGLPRAIAMRMPLTTRRFSVVEVVP
jgi:hypothetical protein